VLESVLKEGAYLILSRFACQTALLEKTHRLIRDAVESLEGSAARHVLDTHGLGALHVALPAARIGELRDVVMPQIRPDLLTLACEIGRTVLCIEGEFFVDDYTILRINYPYLVALQAPGAAENPGIGRVADRTRLESNASRVIDPVYDPKGYHENQPPPAWAHGPHQDTWTGHSRSGVNLWWAVDDVQEECSLVLYPETFGRPLIERQVIRHKLVDMAMRINAARGQVYELAYRVQHHRAAPHPLDRSRRSARDRQGRHCGRRPSAA